MKKIFFVAASAILLAAGCQKTEVLNQVVPDGEPSMSYAPSMGKLTKAASQAGLDTLRKQNFHLWAYYVAADPNRVGANANTIYDGMENIAVTYTPATDGNAGGWSTDPVHFWPGKEKKLKFFAVSANERIFTDIYTEGNIVPDVAESSENYGGLTINSFVVDPTQPTSDLMVADYLEQDQSNLDVALNFRHALSKVQILFRNDKADGNDATTQVWVQHVEVKKIKNQGKLIVAKNSDNAKRFTWTPSGEAAFIADYVGTPSAATVNDPADKASEYDIDTNNSMKLPKDYTEYATWLVIPQDLAGLNIEIVYVIGDRQFVATFPLATTSVTAWQPNQYIKYNINLSPNIIGFNPTVEEWDSVDNPNINE